MVGSLCWTRHILWLSRFLSRIDSQIRIKLYGLPPPPPNKDRSWGVEFPLYLYPFVGTIARVCWIPDLGCLVSYCCQWTVFEYEPLHDKSEREQFIYLSLPSRIADWISGKNLKTMSRFPVRFRLFDKTQPKEAFCNWFIYFSFFSASCNVMSWPWR